MIDHQRLLIARLEREPPMDYALLITRLRHYGISVAEIAAACERDRWWVWRIESRKTKKIDVEQAKTLEKLLNIVLGG